MGLDLRFPQLQLAIDWLGVTDHFPPTMSLSKSHDSNCLASFALSPVIHASCNHFGTCKRPWAFSSHNLRRRALSLAMCWASSLERHESKRHLKACSLQLTECYFVSVFATLEGCSVTSPSAGRFNPPRATPGAGEAGAAEEGATSEGLARPPNSCMAVMASICPDLKSSTTWVTIDLARPLSITTWICSE